MVRHIIKECAKCDKIRRVKETPSGFEICKECWEKYSNSEGVIW